jgi:L-lactate dehydrogenase (cytochrome)
MVVEHGADGVILSNHGGRQLDRAAVPLGVLAKVVDAILYRLMAGGERGVQRAVDILSAEATRTMRLLGVRSFAELTPAHVKLPATLRD